MEVITAQIKSNSQTHTHTQSGQNAICWHINKTVKATISFNMSTCLSVGKTQLQLDGLLCNLMLF